MRNIVVIGGGFAGLSAATALAERGFVVTVIEGRQVLGGRAYSFTDPQTGDSVDNGQHLFMSCYHNTRAFLRRIGTSHLLKWQTSLGVDFVGDQQRSAKLRCLPIAAPWHLVSGLARLSTLSWGDRLRLFYVHRALKRADREKDLLDEMTIDQWLTRAKQSTRAKRYFWDLIALAAINEDPQVASATGFVQVLKRAFFEEWTGSRLGISLVGLSDLYIAAARRLIEENGGKILLKSPVQRMELRDGRISEVVLREGTRVSADAVISTVPAPALARMLPNELLTQPVFSDLEKFRYSPIISIHLWFDRPVTRRLFVGLLDTQVQWLFNKSRLYDETSTQGYVSLVISGARNFEEWTDKKLLTMALEELRRLFPKAREAALIRSLVIKEHQATLSPVPGTEAMRPEHQSPIANLFLAGDWTRTGLPATIESACASGHSCADLISSRIHHTFPSPLAGEGKDERENQNGPLTPTPSREGRGRIEVIKNV